MNKTNNQEVIIYGGAFNPPTLAHQRIIEACLASNTQAEVWVMPSGERRDKTGMVSDKDRLGMLEHMKAEVFAGTKRLQISDFELTRPRPSVTARTVAALALRYPTISFRYVFGADSYASMPTWEQGEQLQQNLPLLLVPRAGYTLPPQNDRLKHLALPETSTIQTISSTEVRRRIAIGQQIGTVVCRSVGAYIRANQLYVGENTC